MKQKDKNKNSERERGRDVYITSAYPFHFCRFVVIPSPGFSNKLICWTEADDPSLAVPSRIFTDPKLKFFVLNVRMIIEASNTLAYSEGLF